MNIKASTLYTFTAIVVCLSVLGGIITGAELKRTPILENYGTIFILSAFIGTAMYAVPCFALATVLENQEAIMSEQVKQSQKIAEISYKTKDENLSDLAPSVPSSSPPPSVKYFNDTWTCKSCGEKNPRSSQFCKSCGKYK